MDVNSIVTLISNLGFPIVVCAAMFWYINKQADQHKTEMDKVTEAITNNTLIVTRLCEKLDREEK